MRMKLLVMLFLPLLGSGMAHAAMDAPGPDAPRIPAGKPKTGKPAESSPGSRGQLLYENHCQACHTSRLHIREHRRAKSLAELRGWVIRWSQTLKLNWSDEEVEDVVGYLNHRYYKLSVRR